jgi:uncharacterized protein YkwD
MSVRAQAQNYQPNIENIKIKIIDYLNQLRTLNKLKPLAEDDKAMLVAQKRAEYQSNSSLTHDGLREMLKEIKDPIYGTENLAWVHPSSYNSDDELAEAVIILWYVDEGVENKGHHKQMLNPLYDFTGVGIKKDNDGYFYISQVMFSDIDISPSKVTKETVDEINEFYNYFNSDKLNKSIPLK